MEVQTKTWPLAPLFICAYTVKFVLNGHSKIDKTKIFMKNGSLMKVESFEAFCNTFDLH